MVCVASNPHTTDRTQARLGSKIVLVLVVKIAGLTAIWFLFIRGQGVTTDAYSTARAFGLTTHDSGSHSTIKEGIHGR